MKEVLQFQHLQKIFTVCHFEPGEAYNHIDINKTETRHFNFAYWS